MISYFVLINLLVGSVRIGQDRIFHVQKSARHSKHRHTPGLGPMLFVLALVFPACAQESLPEHVVFPITDFRPDIKHLTPFSMQFGTGFCLDEDCRFVGTNYHVAKVMGENVRIQGVRSVHCYLDSGEDDEEARNVRLFSGGSLKFTPAHDLAIYEMQHPLKGFHGIGFDADEPEHGAEVDVYAYPFNFNPKRGLVHWHGQLMGKTADGQLAFSYEERSVRGGASGGIVVDRKTRKVIGILSAVGEDGEHRLAFAVPVQELSNFVARAQPFLQTALFPKTVFVSPVSPDLYGAYSFPIAKGLSRRQTEPPEVVRLRHTAQDLADSMRNFTAVETFAWGHGNREPDTAAAYETFIAKDRQRWRRPGESTLHDDVPVPLLTTFVVSGNQWSQLPRTVGTELNLRINQAQDAVVGGRTVHVFQYAAIAEDRVCSFRTIEKVLGFEWSNSKYYDCHGEVWTDEGGIILRISQTIDIPGPWYHFWLVMTYGWAEKDGKRFLVPATITAQADPVKVYWCRGLFTDYQMFGESKAGLVLPPTGPRPNQESTLATLSNLGGGGR